MFRLSGIPPAPRGIPQVEVTFNIDANGIIDVAAKDRATGKEQKITITATTKLGKDEIERMVKDAEKFSEEDKKRRQKAELKNRAEQKAYEVPRLLEELGDKVPQDLRDRLSKMAEELKNVISTDDESKIKEKLDELEKALLEIGKRVYGDMGKAQQEQAPPPGPEAGPEGGDKGYVDADFRVVDDDEKK
jgi:molecular chaperone DnaK